MTFDRQLWDFDRDAKFTERQRELITGAAGAPPAKRSASRLDLARFYLSRDMFAEAKAVLDVAIQDDRPNAENPTALVLRSFANIMLDRVEPALKDLANPLVGNQHDAQLWRALAYVRQGKWAEAREHFRDVDGAMGTLPVELQRIALKDRLRAAVEVGDFAGAAATAQRSRDGRRAARARSRRSRCSPGGWPRGSAAAARRSPPIAPPPLRRTGRPRRRAGCARSCCATSSARPTRRRSSTTSKS